MKVILGTNICQKNTVQALRTTAIVVSVKSSVKQKQIFERENYLHKYNMVTTKKHISVSL